MAKNKSFLFFRYGKIQKVIKSLDLDKPQRTEMPNLKQPHDDLGRFRTPYPQAEPLLKKSLGLRLPESGYQKAVELAQKKGVSLSRLLREATLAGLKQIEDQEHLNT